MFLCMKHVLEVGAEPELPVPWGVSVCWRGRGGGGAARAQARPRGLQPALGSGCGSHSAFAGAVTPAVSLLWFPSNACLATAG